MLCCRVWRSNLWHTIVFVELSLKPVLTGGNESIVGFDPGGNARAKVETSPLLAELDFAKLTQADEEFGGIGELFGGGDERRFGKLFFGRNGTGFWTRSLMVSNCSDSMVCVLVVSTTVGQAVVMSKSWLCQGISDQMASVTKGAIG